MLRAGLETGYWMGLAHRAITPLPSRHHLGPLLTMCPSTPPQYDATFDQELINHNGPGLYVIRRAQTWPARTLCVIGADGLFSSWRRMRSAIDNAKN
jgi:hypothetical protein